ncbi:HD domain-containing phosphohydrolase [Tepidibacter formicigenes]|uniref:Stage 0 sporulation protein A homolog n=1 Tax=Tepidibacter formicigenes DSM 15518 TaxID=1123349 RepID=A0A1M6QSF3_9FIRM|nr:HD domain-containing phosphohydrolase [Tepidibacter formicigenes]SHK23249.1 putative two-component system response regulator [Tepidibacter formicigenes DSM 15518]
MEDNKKTILVIDDEEVNLKLIEAMLIPMGYKVILYKSAKIAIQDINSINPDVILLDIMMPVMNGFEFLKKIKFIPEMRNVPVVMVTALNDVKSRVISLELGADDFLSKPIDKIELRARVKSLVKVKEHYDYIKNHNKILEQEVRKKTLEISESYRKLVAVNKELKNSLQNIVLMGFDLMSIYDESLAGHCKRVAVYASMITEKMNIKKELKQVIKIAALLHDIGLIGMPKNKRIEIEKNENVNENVNEELLQIYKNHPLAPIRAFQETEKYREVIDIIQDHHENIDGTGFPKGKLGNEIHTGAKIIALADYYDLQRYKTKKLKSEELLEYIELKVNTWFDKEIFEIFRGIILKEDPFSGIVKVYIENLKEGMTIAEPIVSIDTGVILLGPEITLDKEKLDKIKEYSSRFEIKNPIKVYKHS